MRQPRAAVHPVPRVSKVYLLLLSPRLAPRPLSSLTWPQWPSCLFSQLPGEILQITLFSSRTWSLLLGAAVCGMGSLLCLPASHSTRLSPVTTYRPHRGPLLSLPALCPCCPLSARSRSSSMAPWVFLVSGTSSYVLTCSSYKAWEASSAFPSSRPHSVLLSRRLPCFSSPSFLTST